MTVDYYLAKVEKEHPRMKPHNQRALASRLRRGLPAIKKTPRRNKPLNDSDESPSAGNYWDK